MNVTYGSECPAGQAAVLSFYGRDDAFFSPINMVRKLIPGCLKLEWLFSFSGERTKNAKIAN